MNILLINIRILRRFCPCRWFAGLRARALSRGQTCRICAGIAALLSYVCTERLAALEADCPPEQVTINEVVINLPGCPLMMAVGFTPLPKVLMRETIQLMASRLSPKNVRVIVM